MDKRYISFDQMKSYCSEMIRQMIQDDWKPDLIVGITRGGALPAVMLSHFLGCKMVGLDVSLRDNSNLEVSGPEHNCWVPELATNGRNILIVDDINDTGATINWILDDWDCPKGSIRWGDNVRFAVIIDNEDSRSKVTPQYCGEVINKAVKDEWLVFCYEDWWKSQ